MADVNEYLQKIQEKNQKRQEKLASKTKSFKKGIRPYNYVNKPQEGTLSENDLSFLNEEIVEVAPTVEVPPEPVIEVVAEVKTQPVVEEIKTPVIAKPVQASPVKSNDTYEVQASDLVNYEQFTHLKRGYTKFPNEILFKLAKGDINHCDLRVLVVIVRLSLGFNKKWVTITAEYVSEITGIPQNRIFKSFKNLISEELLEKRNSVPGNKNSSNSYKVIFSGKEAFMESELEIEEMTPELQKYLDSILVKAQRESEGRAVRELLKYMIPGSEIAEAIEFLKTSGIPGSGDKPNNPAMFLAKAGSDVFKKIRNKKNRLEIESHQSAETQVDFDLSEANEKKFETHFPDATTQEEMIKKMVEKYQIVSSANMPYPKFIERRLAINKWAEFK